MKGNNGISVIVPAYNEEAGIVGVISQLKKINQGWEIIVVDDGSTDRTAELARDKDVKFIRHPENRGYGAAIKTGIKNAKNEIIVITDADLTYPVEEIPGLVSYMGEYDMAVGARTDKGAQIPLLRRPAKWCVGKIANYLTRMSIPDINSGLRVFKKHTALKYFHLLPSGFSFTTTITLALLTDDYKIKYIPIHYYKRKGKSKIRPLSDTLNFLQLIIQTILYFNPLRIFIPISSGLFGLGFLLLLYRVFMRKGFLVTSVIVFILAIQFFVLGLIADLIVKRSKV